MDKLAAIKAEIAAKESANQPALREIEDLKRAESICRGHLVEWALSVNRETKILTFPLDHGKVELRPGWNLAIYDPTAFREWVEANHPALIDRSVKLTAARPLVTALLKDNPDLSIPGVRMEHRLSPSVSPGKSAGLAQSPEEEPA